MPAYTEHPDAPFDTLMCRTPLVEGSFGLQLRLRRGRLTAYDTRDFGEGTTLARPWRPN